MISPYYEIAKAIIIRHEGYSSQMYKCTAGRNTIGYGHNLDAKGISKKAAEQILEDDLVEFTNKAAQYPWFNFLNDARKAVIVDMLFNMGSLDEWKNFQAALAAQDYVKAVGEMQKSKWYNQVGVRAVENCKIMLTGTTNGLDS